MANYGTIAGTPAPALVSGMALRRSISARVPDAARSGDDTNNSATDFSPATPNPRSNAVAPTETRVRRRVGGGQPSSSGKKKCKKHEGPSPSPGPGAYSAKKHKCKKRK